MKDKVGDTRDSLSLWYDGEKVANAASNVANVGNNVAKLTNTPTTFCSIS